MLRCAISRNLPRSLQISPRWSLSCGQRLAEKSCHQTRLLSFLPIVSSLDTAQKTSTRESGFHKHLTIQSPDGMVDPDQSASGPRNDTGLEKSDAASFGENAAQLGHYSATLADGTIVHNDLEPVTLSQFEDLVSLISQIWTQYSSKIIPQVSAYNIGIQVWTHPDHTSSLFTRIYDTGKGSRGYRRTWHYEWSLPLNGSNFSIVESRYLPRIRVIPQNLFLEALKNHIGSVDRHGSLTKTSPPSPHTLYYVSRDLKRMFACNIEDPEAKSQSMSVVLDDGTIVSPTPSAVIETGPFLSLATIVWQWWQQEQSIRSEVSEITTLIRMMYVC
jgi:hypothetical protein